MGRFERNDILVVCWSVQVSWFSFQIPNVLLCRSRHILPGTVEFPYQQQVNRLALMQIHLYHDRNSETLEGASNSMRGLLSNLRSSVGPNLRWVTG
jgi:hypothetical protein